MVDVHENYYFEIFHSSKKKKKEDGNFDEE